MKRLPEWFVSGPLHGKDRVTEFPGREQIRYVANDEHGNQWHYHRQTFVIGAVAFIIWADFRNDSKELVESKFAEILMAPHVISEPDRCEHESPDNTGDRDRWEDSRDTFGGETDNTTGNETGKEGA